MLVNFDVLSGFSGISPLFLARNLESSGVAPLVLPNVLGVHSWVYAFEDF